MKPQVTIGEMKTKFLSLKTTSLVEYRKQQRSHCSGAGEDGYTPSLWYYDKIKFVLEHQTPRQSYDSYSPDDVSSESQASIIDDDAQDTIAEEIDQTQDKDNTFRETYEIDEDETLNLLTRTPKRPAPTV
ncbi:hypothetical protein PPYR_00022 [Photinus pyralis]|uniref:MADF domain-containing protein n=1 Tax=Photinus pyralis TaxID=7054 RepID=A0A5N4B0D2_PHOPY|nr:uncharacterized protein LOC116159077 [Photinus pyralis]XP_031327837.1 uncharacterized protein LOC116159077 [Photinus pyralis]KAB0803052.1 hypothetical protein PPYR_00022 [Photinus pyralis]